jgi:hypothetical protein
MNGNDPSSLTVIQTFPYRDLILVELDGVWSTTPVTWTDTSIGSYEGYLYMATYIPDPQTPMDANAGITLLDVNSYDVLGGVLASISSQTAKIQVAPALQTTLAYGSRRVSGALTLHAQNNTTQSAAFKLFLYIHPAKKRF